MTEHSHDRLERATESTMAKAITRFGVPALLSVVVIMGGMVLTDIRAAINVIDDRSLRQGTQIQAVDTKVELLDTKIDNGLLWRLGEIERRVDQLEERR